MLRLTRRPLAPRFESKQAFFDSACSDVFEDRLHHRSRGIEFHSAVEHLCQQNLPPVLYKSYVIQFKAKAMAGIARAGALLGDV